MLGTPPVTGPLRGLVQRLQDWPVASQQQARRNAMIASTACAQRRAEREDVADFFAHLSAPDGEQPAVGVPEVTTRGRTTHG